MTWEYRVMEHNGELAIYEVHYDDDGRVRGYGEHPTYPAANTMEALRENCELYVAALDKPVLRYD